MPNILGKYKVSEEFKELERSKDADPPQLYETFDEMNAKLHKASCDQEYHWNCNQGKKKL
jgi:hypothetical protein